MSESRVVLVNAAPCCGADHRCDSLAESLRGYPPCRSLELCVPATLLTRAKAPVMVVVRFPAGPIPELLAAPMRQWPETSFVGILCGGARPGERLGGLLETLDDFLVCPFWSDELIERIRRIIPETVRPPHQGRLVREKLKLDFLVGESPCFLDLLQILPSMAASEASVLITGETGTGKEVFARAIHYNSSRRGSGFIPVNCGALPDHLIENELFGHSSGAFTGATTSEKGLIATAEGGTLFLDEVDALSLAAQVKLLRFLQDREYRPLGSARTVTADVRIIAATNADLRRRVEAGQMRDDLFHRLHLLTMHIPPLRERGEDIELLARHLLRKYAAQYARPKLAFAPGVTRHLQGYNWPGNVRELEGAVHRAVVMAEGETLRLDDLLHSGDDRGAPRPITSLRDMKSQRIAQWEQVYLVELLARNGGNVSRAAREAGKERRAFQRLLRKYGIERACG